MASADYKIELDGKLYTPDELREYYKSKPVPASKHPYGWSELKPEWVAPKPLVPDVWADELVKKHAEEYAKELLTRPTFTGTPTYVGGAAKRPLSPKKKIVTTLIPSEAKLQRVVMACLPEPGEGRNWEVHAAHDITTLATNVGIVLRDLKSREMWQATFQVDEEATVDIVRLHVENAVKQLVVKIAEKQLEKQNVHRETQGQTTEDAWRHGFVRAGSSSDPSSSAPDAEDSRAA